MNVPMPPSMPASTFQGYGRMLDMQTRRQIRRRWRRKTKRERRMQLAPAVDVYIQDTAEVIR